MPRTKPALWEEIIAFNGDRKRKLVRLKLARMDANPFAFFRGTDHLFAAAWPELQPPDSGPAVWISGDLHLENFGAYQASDGKFRFDINDFDEALIAPCSFDLVRCASSILLAAELWQITPLVASDMVLAYLDSYRQAIDAARDSSNREISFDNAPEPIWDILGATARARPEELLFKQTHLTKSGKRRIQLSDDKHPPIQRKRRSRIRKAVEAYLQDQSTDRFRVIDVTGRIAGIGSLGVRRYLVLVEANQKVRLMDVKEARPSSVLSCSEVTQPDFGDDEAARMVFAQEQVQAAKALGLGHLKIINRSFRIRQMIPDEHRSSLDHLRRQPEKLLRAVQVAGRVTGWSQWRGSQLADSDRSAALSAWSARSTVDAIVSSAARFARRAVEQYETFHKAYRRFGDDAVR
jgi:uncharacterized protein (DUF2252 family)